MSQCYGWSVDEQKTFQLNGADWTLAQEPCPSTNQCCVPGDKCMDHSICQFIHTVDSNSTNVKSGYYISGCKDPLFQDPSCSKVCYDQAYPDVVYSQDKKIWQCCGTAPGTGNVTCDNPADESFSAPALEALVAIQPSTIESNSTSSASTTTGNNGSSATNVSTSTSTARQTSATSASMSGLNTGAKAGIGIGVALVAMLAIVACIFLCARARRRAKKQSAAQAVPSEAHRGTFAGYAHERNAMVMRQPQEIEGRSRPLQPQELEGRWTPHDLT